MGDDASDLTGKKLGRYRVDSVLGKGGMSVTYRATDTRLGRKVALKVIGDQLGTDAEFRERFVDEARSTAAIDHPNIVPLYDFGEIDDMHYIGMRLVDGADLASLVKPGPMEPSRAIGLLEQVADALDTLHKKGLVHLDVKPANVLVTQRESIKEHVYVADFGLTRRGATGHRTRGGDFLGSPTYAAPEHLKSEPLDGRTDQYALACVLFACLTGRPPFPGDVQQVIQGHLNKPPPKATALVPRLPAGIDDVIAKGMSKDPAGRYDSCVALIAAAKAVFDNARVAAPAARAPHTSGPFPAPTGGMRPPPGQPGPGQQQPPIRPGMGGPQAQPGPFGRQGQSGPPERFGQGPPQAMAPQKPADKVPPGWLLPTLYIVIVALVIALVVTIIAMA